MVLPAYPSIQTVFGTPVRFSNPETGPGCILLKTRVWWV